MLYCMGCHGAEANGVPGKVPPLAGSLALFMRTPEGRNYVLRVPGAANSALSDAQLSAVLNWIAERYGAPGGGPATGGTSPSRKSRAPATCRWRTCRRRGARWSARWPPPAARRLRTTEACGAPHGRIDLLTEYRCDADGPRAEREVTLQPGDARHERIDRRVVTRQRMGIGQIVDEGRERP